MQKSLCLVCIICAVQCTCACAVYYRGKMKYAQRSVWLAVQAAPPGSEPRGEGVWPTPMCILKPLHVSKVAQGASMHDARAMCSPWEDHGGTAQH
uniref:Putative secreted protein n=1 Tax=Ixodes ricinus TaxID=34613 RepID=A0A6B0UEZ7_IXORI